MTDPMARKNDEDDDEMLPAMPTSPPEEVRERLHAVPAREPMHPQCSIHASLLQEHSSALLELHKQAQLHNNGIHTQLEEIRGVLIGSTADSNLPGVLEQLRTIAKTMHELVERVGIQNGRVTRHEGRINKIIWSAVGMWLAIGAFWAVFAWAVDHGLIQILPQAQAAVP